MWVLLNGQFVHEKEACVSVFDRGFLYGDGVFETLRVHGHQVKFLDDHLSRLRESCRLINLSLTNPEPRWEAQLHELCVRNSLEEAVIRITVTRGISGAAFGSPVTSEPTVVMISRPLPMLSPEERECGVSVVTTDIRRQSPLALPPRMKSLNYLNNILARQEATEKAAFEGLMFNTDDYIAECTTSNVFFVIRGHLCTPSVECGILPGITRKTILKLARIEGIEVREGLYQRQALSQASECFLTNIAYGVLPVRRVDNHQMLSYGKGTITARLHRAYSKFLTSSE